MVPQDVRCDLGVRCYQEGPPLSLLEAQAERGFAHVSEKVLEDLLRSKGKAVPPCEDDEI